MNKSYRIDGEGFFTLAVKGDKSEITFCRTLTYDKPIEHTLKGKARLVPGDVFLNSVCNMPFEEVRDNIMLQKVFINHLDSNLGLFLQIGDNWMAFGHPVKLHGFVVNDVEFREICKVHDVVVQYKDLREERN